MKMLVVGCGYLGKRVAGLWLRGQHEVWGTTRSMDRAQELSKIGIRSLLWDVGTPSDFAGLRSIDVILYAVGYRRGQTESRADLHRGGLQNLLNGLPEFPKKLVYVSSTGVFGNVEGEAVDEESPCVPTTDSGIALLEAERFLQRHTIASRVVIVRLAGLYGPGRIPRVSIEHQSSENASGGTDCINLLHIDDAARAVELAAAQAHPPALYVISDGNPVTRCEFQREASRYFGTGPRASNPGIARKSGNKRVDPAKIRSDLGFSCTYPSFREGLAQIAATQTQD